MLSKFWARFCVVRCFLDFSVDVGAFDIGLSQIFSFFSRNLTYNRSVHCTQVSDRCVCPLWSLAWLTCNKAGYITFLLLMISYVVIGRVTDIENAQERRRKTDFATGIQTFS